MSRFAVPPESRAGVVVPIRSFTAAKERLADHVSSTSRATAARWMAERVLEAARPFAVVVVTADREVREWATAQSVGVIDDPGNLDAAATAGRDHFAAAGCVRVVVAHADLPRARSLASLTVDGSRPTVAVVPCHRDDGSNVLSVPVDAPFRFVYGPGSFRRHVSQARILGLGVRVLRDPNLTIDVDGPDDLHHLDGTPAECAPLQPSHVPG